MKTLKQMPVPVAIGIMVLCIVAGLAFGNHNALSDAKAAPEAILTEVSAMASQRASTAKNLLVVANRNAVDTKNVAALQQAIEDLEDARRADKIASANRGLTFATDAIVTELQQVADSQDKKLTTGVDDDLKSLDKQIARRGTAYNDSLQEVQRLYKTLPMRWIIGGLPEVYQ